MAKTCFVISPMGDEGTPIKARADYVLETYIRPACLKAGYEPVRADQGVGQDIVRGITNAIQNAPMVIAYLGATPEGEGGSSLWNANVMIEIGYRLAARLPLVFLCDRNSRNQMPPLPLSLSMLNVIGLPVPDPTVANWTDNKWSLSVDKLAQQLEIEAKRKRFLDCSHPLATIHAASCDSKDAGNLFYTSASYVADSLFGIKLEGDREQRLVGRSMDQFLEGVKQRMHPVQWKAFEQDQKGARRKLSEQMTGNDGRQSVANVPIVFEKHENDEFNNRAYLPVIVQDYRPDRDGCADWYQLRVLYLDVTTITEKAVCKNGEEYYVCRLDHTSNARLDPLNSVTDDGVKVFISYARRNQAAVEDFVETTLIKLRPHISPFMDVSMVGGINAVRELFQNMQSSDICFLFVDDQDFGPGQATEIDWLASQAMTGGGRNYPIVPLLLKPNCGNLLQRLPFIGVNQWVPIEHLSEMQLKLLFWSHFPKRCPQEWSGGGGRAIPVHV